MKRIVKFLRIGVSAALFAAMAIVPAAAQEQPDGTVIQGNFGGDVITMNPIYVDDAVSAQLVRMLNIGFLGVDPNTAMFAPNQPGALVQNWDTSADGTVYTFHLRNDLTWTDEMPITSAAVMYTWQAIQTAAENEVNQPFAAVIDSSRKTGILDVQAPDDYTVVVTFATAHCTALRYASALVPVPAHVLPDDLSELINAPYTLEPTVTSGAFRFAQYAPGEYVSLFSNPDYADAAGDAVQPGAFIYANVVDDNAAVDQFLAGGSNLIDNPLPSRRDEIRASGAQVHLYPGNRWDYLAFNQADPTDPQNGLDPSGNVIDQGHHPIFGDVQVRQAIAHAIDVQSIINATLSGEGTRMTSNLMPSSWAYNQNLPPIGYDPALASQMLNQAGWIDDDNDPATPRVARGARYAPDGTPFVFTLYTDQGNTRHITAGTMIRDELAQIGIQVDLQPIDFQTLVDIARQQTFDAYLLGWQNGYPDDPDQTQLFTPQSDVIAGGSNFTSFNNPQVTDLINQANSVPGCQPADRAPIYARIQELMQQEVPYVWLFAINGMYAVGPNIQGFDPQPANYLWNSSTWLVSTP